MGGSTWEGPDTEWRQMMVSMKLFSLHNIVISILRTGKLRPKPARVAKPGTLSHLLHSREFLVVLVVRWPHETSAKAMRERTLTALGASSDWLDHQRPPSPPGNRLIPWSKGGTSRRNQTYLSRAFIPPLPLSQWDSVHKPLTGKTWQAPAPCFPGHIPASSLKATLYKPG